MTFLNLIEPEGLVSHFLAHPPQDCVAGICASRAPYFAMRFDLLTTADQAVRSWVARVPFKPLWQPLIRPMSSFIGTTVSEYVVLPAQLPPAQLLAQLFEAFGKRHPLTIIKDIPSQSPLLDGRENQYAEDLVDACERAGWILLSGQALAYVRIDFRCIGEYLGRLSASRRRDLRRKLRTRDRLEIESMATGDPALRSASLRAELYELYSNVFIQSTVHFDRLSRQFFDAVLQDASCHGVIFLYRHHGQLIGYNLCFVQGDKLIDKYIGFRYPQARELNLYFVSWIENLKYALDLGLRFYIAGWTDPEVKRSLGAEFTWTRHAVYARRYAVRALLRLVRRWFESDRAVLEAHCP